MSAPPHLFSIFHETTSHALTARSTTRNPSKPNPFPKKPIQGSTPSERRATKKASDENHRNDLGTTPRPATPNKRTSQSFPQNRKFKGQCPSPIYMKLITRFFHRFPMSLFVLMLPAVLTTACSKSLEDVVEETSTNVEEVYLRAAIRTRATGTAINNTNAEEAVKTIRLVICDSGTGDVIYNTLHNVAHFTNQPEGVTTIWHDPFKITPGTRDFYFIANEESWSGLSAALNTLTNRSQFYTNTTFTQLPYDENYKPTADKPMIMTRMYRNVNVASDRNGKGTQADPQHFVADGDEEVELIRTLSKVRIRVKNVVEVEKEGDEFVGKRFNFKYLNNFKRLTLGGFPPYFSLFLNPYFENGGYPTGKFFSSEYYPSFTPAEKTVETTAALANNEVTYTTASLNTETGVKTYYDYVTTLYVPEHLRPYAETEKEAEQTVATATSWRFYNQVGSPFYYASVDHRDFTGQSTGSGKLFQLTSNDAAKYSRYSMIRNNFYDIEAEERDYKLYLKYTVKPWEDVVYDHVYVGQYYNIVVPNNAFPQGEQTVNILTASEIAAARDFKVVVRPANSNVTITPAGSTTTATEIAHTNKGYQMKTSFTLNLAADAAVGDGILEVYFNDELVYTIKKK